MREGDTTDTANPTFEKETGETEEVSPRSMNDVRKYADLAVFGSTAEADNAEAELDLHYRQKWCGLLHPESTNNQLFNQVQMVSLVYLLIVLPYRIAFDIAPPVVDVAFWVDFVIDISIAVDIFLNFFRYHFDHSRSLITDYKILRFRYVRSWFLIDIASVFPFDYVITFVLSNAQLGEQARSTRLLRLGRIARFARLAKLTKLSKIGSIADSLASFLQELGVSSLEFQFFLRIIGLVGLMMAIGHLLGCIWLQVR
eukprot:SAG31_NODE_154_length_22184_cov_25.917142_17_plen_256_part_00